MARWQVVGGSDAQRVAPLRSVAKKGFETAIALRSLPTFVAVRALDADGVVLATSAARRT